MMKLFRKKEKIMIRSEQQKVELIDKLEKAHIEYDIRMDRDNSPDDTLQYVIRVYAEDLPKVVA